MKLDYSTPADDASDRPRGNPVVGIAGAIVYGVLTVLFALWAVWGLLCFLGWGTHSWYAMAVIVSLAALCGWRTMVAIREIRRR